MKFLYLLELLFPGALCNKDFQHLMSLSAEEVKKLTAQHQGYKCSDSLVAIKRLVAHTTHYYSLSLKQFPYKLLKNDFTL